MWSRFDVEPVRCEAGLTSCHPDMALARYKASPNCNWRDFEPGRPILPGSSIEKTDKSGQSFVNS